ncbi:NAD(P)-dependent oxidoreductase [Acutalibacter caecimuris]|uniref:NAD(P)-dependent oxidoreductase n=1 Tax=Acutalibacter caecimuris TaxID=3093657 RepID=UPI002AC94947|nr:NAD(P)-dependent oxidoreductase [Acutalibacter sp. M00118]
MQENSGTHSVYVTMGASNHTERDRHPDDFYATEPAAIELLLSKEKFAPEIWECACGMGHLSEVLKAHGYNVISTDLVYRGYGDPEPLNFLSETLEDFEGDIITNPPYKYALEFVERAIESVAPGRKVAMFLKLQFLEGQKRKQLFLKNPPKTVYVSSSRLYCAKNGEFERYKDTKAIAYAWFVWVKGFMGDTVIKWIN